MGLRGGGQHSFLSGKSFKGYLGFTLAEVLITLGIIGVVAAMTLPSVINNTKNKQLESAFKVAYSIFNQAVLNMRAEDGEGLKERYAVYDEANKVYPDAEEFYDKFYKYAKLKVIGACKHQSKIMNFNNTAEAYTSYSGEMGSGKEGFFDALSNGMCASILINAGTINFAVDVNGIKRPNRLGHDIFYFYIDSTDRLLPRKMSKLYTDEELEDLKNGNDKFADFVAGSPCSMSSTQKGNGVGCTYNAIVDESPEDATKGYWENLPK